MHQGAVLLGYTAMLTLAACAGGQRGQLTIRSTGIPLSGEALKSSSKVAEGRAQFALGNVALALEMFRKAIREQPGNVDALIGVGLCYDRMGRHDLSRKHYEAALAVEPANGGALTALATSLELQGRTGEATAVRAELLNRGHDPLPVQAIAVAATPAGTAKMRAEAALPNTAGTSQDTSVASTTYARSITVELPPRPATTEQVAIQGQVTAVAPISYGPSVTIELRSPRAAAPGSKQRQVSASDPTPYAPSVTIELPPRPSAAQAQKHANVSRSSVNPVPVADVSFNTAMRAASSSMARGAAEPMMERRTARKGSKAQTGPVLERISMAEVALVTRRAESGWSNPPLKRTAEASRVRYVPLRLAQGRVPIRLLNAAGVNRLAANTRLLIFRRGWKNVVIGNAPAVRTRSLVLYPAGARHAAQQLAAQLGFASALRSNSREVTVLLGRDALRMRRKRAIEG